MDLCCGSGAIGVSIAKLHKGAKVTCADVSAKALAVAKKNAAANGCKGVKFVESDLFAASDFHRRFGKGKYQLIISNPPYIRHEVIDTLEPEVRAHEPMLALDGGADGLEFYRRIIAEAPEHLKKAGVLMMEIGYDQKEAVKALLHESGRFEKIIGLTDLTGKDRIVFSKQEIESVLNELSIEHGDGSVRKTLRDGESNFHLTVITPCSTHHDASIGVYEPA